LPYCSGLKPRFNYQKLLRLIVLEFIDRMAMPVLAPQEILAQRLGELRARGLLRAKSGGSGRFGLAIEAYLGIPQNSNKNADFMGIELKTKHTGTGLQTLFSRTPTRYTGAINKSDLFRRYSYRDDKRDRRALYTSFSSSPDTLGFYPVPNNDTITITNDGESLAEYDAEAIESALLLKHSQTAFVAVKKETVDGEERFRVVSARYCKWPSIICFVRLIKAGKVNLDFTMSEKCGKIRDHGFPWRIRSEALPELFLSDEPLIDP
jgi:MvaI/BcnI restriction endonuclease family protein